MHIVNYWFDYDICVVKYDLYGRKGCTNLVVDIIYYS
jgi:hypothetical protein